MNETLIGIIVAIMILITGTIAKLYGANPFVWSFVTFMFLITLILVILELKETGEKK